MISLNTVDLIRKKRAGNPLSKEEISFLIEGYSSGDIPDYQMSALTMAIYFQGMNEEETSHLTMAMVKSGDQVDLSSIKGKKVDKHSTGGVGDTTTLVIAPLVASAGVCVAKLSGRGLGHTGGTVDKLEAIPGFSVELEVDEFVRRVNQSQLAVMGQTGNLTPADKKLYALRDVTATVESIPLIASSIMSKKIAAGADGIVLDVKFGEGAFLKSEEEATHLARVMVDIGKSTGRDTVAVVSDMSQPLGYAVGNALEVIEAIETLKGEGPEDLTELSLVLASQMLVLANRCATSEEARNLLEQCIQDGRALAKFKELIRGQNGNTDVIDSPKLFPQAKNVIVVLSEQDGFIQSINAEQIGHCAMELGAGRKKKEDIVDHAVGIVLKKKVGDPVKVGEPLAALHINKNVQVEIIQNLVKRAMNIGDERVAPFSLIRNILY